jgi:putative hydrolase of the HAD superfamily
VSIQATIFASLHKLDTPKTHWLFDYDLTLYDWQETYVLDSLDVNITQFLIEFGYATPQTANSKRAEWCAQFGTTLGALVAYFGVNPNDYYNYIHTAPGLVLPKYCAHKQEWFAKLKGHCSIFTNGRKDWVGMGLQSMGLQSYFGHIFDIEHGGWVAKPNLQPYSAVQHQLNTQNTGPVAPNQIIFVDDKEVNLKPAKELGWQTVWVNPQYTKPPWVDYCVKTILSEVQ